MGLMILRADRQAKKMGASLSHLEATHMLTKPSYHQLQFLAAQITRLALEFLVNRVAISTSYSFTKLRVI